MSLISAIKHKLGLSVTTANNFLLDASADDGTMKLARESGQDIMTVDAAGKVGFSVSILGFSAGGDPVAGWIDLPSWLGGFQIRFGTTPAATNAGGGGTVSYAKPFSSVAGWPIIGYGDNGLLDGPIGAITDQTTLSGFGFQAIGAASTTIRVNYIAIGS